MRMSAALADSDAAYDEKALSGPALGEEWVHETLLRLDAELGSARLTADEVLGLRNGAVVVLDKAVDDPVELFVNGTPYGAGRLLVDDGEWAIVIDELAAPNMTEIPLAPAPIDEIIDELEPEPEPARDPAPEPEAEAEPIDRADEGQAEQQTEDDDGQEGSD